MNSTKKALLSGLFASFAALCTAQAGTYYIGSALGAVNDTSAANPLGGSITHLDGAVAGRSSVWDLGGATVTLTTAHTYILETAVFVRNGTLVLAPGVIVRGQPRDAAVINPGALAICAGAKIIANGNAGSPIIFTTASTTGGKTGGRAAGASPVFWDADPVNSPKPLVTAGVSATALWGGVIVMGNAPTNIDRNLRVADNPGNVGGAFDDGNRVSFMDENPPSVFSPAGHKTDDRSSIEGIPSTATVFVNGFDRYGGNLPLDNSGILRYVSIRYSGSVFATNTEVNGLTLGGVGAGTTIDFIEIFGNADDGIEIFGGTVNLKHVVVMGVEDDMLDFDAGYTGYVQFAFLVGWGNTGSGSTSADYTDRAIEWDGSYRFERPEGFRGPAPFLSQAIDTGGVGAVTSNQSAAATNMVFNATIWSNVYTGPAVDPVTSPGVADNNDRSRGVLMRDQASPNLLNSIVIPRSYGVRVATRGTEDYTATIKRLENGRGSIQSNTFFGLGGGAAGYVLTGASLASGANGAVRDDVLASRITTILTAAGSNNLFGVDPLFAISLNENLTSGTIDPRPLNGYNAGTGAPVVTTPGEPVDYRGAFPDDPFSDIWTTGWTAANKLTLIAN